MARAGEDPGATYFAQMKKDLKRLFDALQNESSLDRTLVSALFAIGHHSYVNYEAAARDGLQDSGSRF